MANYYCKTRTNYFSVTNEEKFKKIMASCKGTDEIEVINNEDQGKSIKYGFICEGSIDGLPDREDDAENTEDYTEDDCDYNYDAFCKSLQELLPDDDAIIITEVGSENMRYLRGLCTVITHNDIKYLDLDRDAVKLAATMLNNPAFATKNYY
jgi:hypothetical protein